MYSVVITSSPYFLYEYRSCLAARLQSLGAFGKIDYIPSYRVDIDPAIISISVRNWAKISCG